MKAWILRAARLGGSVSDDVLAEVFETEMEALARLEYWHELAKENYLIVSPIEINFLERGK